VIEKSFIKNILLGIYVRLIFAKYYFANCKIHEYLSRSVDHADLKLREEKLKVRNYFYE
jgi:hypothetical protein